MKPSQENCLLKHHRNSLKNCTCDRWGGDGHRTHILCLQPFTLFAVDGLFILQGVEMQQLANFSNMEYEINKILGGNPQKLTELFSEFSLDGLELTLYEDWKLGLYPKEWVKGVHLKFWPNWLDFWYENIPILKEEYAGETSYQQVYGNSLEDWLEEWRWHISQAAATEPQYVVFHVSNARTSELYSRKFAYTSAEVIEATIDLINTIMENLPENITLLYENLWWPGLTFCEPKLADKLLSGTKHQNTGFMLDTGHLLNTSWNLKSEQEALNYICWRVNGLGELADKIQGIHLHSSFSGEFVKFQQEKYSSSVPKSLGWEETFDYISKVDWHKPFETEAAEKIVERIKPKYLVHEFIQESWQDWLNKLTIQQKALGGGINV